MPNLPGKGSHKKNQALLFILALLSLILGILINPERMIALGPLSLSLTSDIPEVKQLAYTEVKLLKMLLSVFALILVALAFSWKKIIKSPIIQAIDNHSPITAITNRQTAFLSIISFLVILFCSIAGLLYMKMGNQIFNPSQLSRIHDEDGLIEYMTALLLVVCCALSMIAAFKFSDHRARMIIHLVMAILFFVMAGEELSWGQRIFSLNTPEIFEKSNVQSEMNLHNMFGYIADHLFILMIFIYGFIMPVLAHAYVFYRKLFDMLGLPIASLGLAIGFLIASMHQRWFVNSLISPPSGFRIEELRELLVAIALFMLMYESLKASSTKKVVLAD